MWLKFVAYQRIYKHFAIEIVYVVVILFNIPLNICIDGWNGLERNFLFPFYILFQRIKGIKVLCKKCKVGFIWHFDLICNGEIKMLKYF